MKNSFNPKNHRIKLAREKHLLNNAASIIILLLAFILLLSGGIVLLIFQYTIGWSIIGLSTIPAMFIFWIKNALASVPIGSTDDFTDMLSEDLLLLLNDKITVEGLIEILPSTRSGRFIMTRFGLSKSFLQTTIQFLPPSVEPIYEMAKDIRTNTDSEAITGAVLLVAIIKNIPDYDRFIHQLRLSMDDLYHGIVWFNYLSGLVQSRRKPLRTGGIARDFTFGYTPTLNRFATNLSERYVNVNARIQQAENAEILNKIIDIFSNSGRKNVALVGGYGSGRSTLVASLAETLINATSSIPTSLKYCQVYSLDAPSLISAANGQGDLEYLMIKIFNEAYSAKNIILCLDNAHLFFEEGTGSVDIGNLLTEVVESGNIRIILVMDDQKFLEIASKNPNFSNALNKIIVHPTDHEETIKILMDQAPILEYRHKVIYTYQSITETYRLSEQYIHDIAMPGKAKLLLESAASYAENGIVTPTSVQSAIEESYGVKVKVADDEEDRGKLLNLEQLIHERMIDQTEAVSAVSNALRRAAAGVKNRGRPIGTFLFLGPTGVGKTELAKTLSEVYFGGEGNLIRLDMNEFVSPSDVSRLIKDGASDPLSLTAQVIKHPFSVILLDEIEKADQSVLTTLLQVLDEGILRDEKNREVSFRDSIIIATSNAGAAEIRRRIEAGEQIGDFKEEITDQLINDGEFKPEFLNRFDEICLFKPLSKEDLLAVLDIIIASTNRTLEPQKISVVVSDEAKQILIDKGYNPKMGARPMRRIVQNTVENIVASAILSGAAQPGSTLTITPSEIKIANA